MGKIFYIMGKSSSGKDTIYSRLLQDSELGLSRIVLLYHQTYEGRGNGGKGISLYRQGFL